MHVHYKLKGIYKAKMDYVKKTTTTPKQNMNYDPAVNI